MTSDEKILVLLEMRVRQLIIKYNEVKDENKRLYAEIDEKNTSLKQINENLEQARRDYNNLMIAKIMEISDSDMENAKSKLSKLIRDVNKCIALLKDEK